MKNVIFFVVGLLCATTVFAQFNIGVKGGVNLTKVSANELFRDDARTPIKVLVQDAGYGFHFGVVADLGLGPLFLRSEATFNSSKSEFRVTDNSQSLVDAVFRESYQEVDVPIIGGLQLGFARLGVGPVFHFHMNNTSDLIKLDSYSTNFRQTGLGYQALLGAKIGNLFVDLKYELRNDAFGDHMVWDGVRQSFNSPDNRFTASVGVFF